MSTSNVLALVGGLALFLYGMSIMGSALEKCAGNRLKSILTKLTSSRLNGFLLGLVVTAVIQSSSATTVMVVGFVNSGIMTLSQSIYIIMGANVGTAVTSWILSLTGISGDAWYITLFKPATFTPVIALIGIFIYLSSKKQKRKDMAGILLGFAVLMFGMEMMSDSVAPLANVPEFTSLMTTFSNPFLGVIAGAVLTAVIQSSSASVGILQALSMTGGVSYAVAIPVIMGQNIGTCITAVISSVGTSKDARRASMIHLYFNVIGMIIWMTVFYVLNAFFHFSFVDMHATPFGIAVVHTAFKLLSTAVLMPFGPQLEKLARFTVRDGKQADVLPMLDERLFVTPSIALERAHTILLEMADLSVGALYTALDLLENYDPHKAEEVVEAENRADMYEDKLGSYLVQLSSHSMSELDSHEMTKYLHMIGDLERISDHAINIMESAQELNDKQLSFSKEATAELSTISRAIRQILDYTLRAMHREDLNIASQVEPLEQVIDLLNKAIRARHIDRLTRGNCTIELGFILNDILTNLERVSDHCSNLAVAIIEIANNSLDVHGYLNDVKANRSEYSMLYEQFRRQFALDEVKEPAAESPKELSDAAPAQS
ncbi:MAG: Na/Pi cotransporter family protein [Eubacteriales bacterium]|nr:Na/Pi cotransporter family protein [Eubacteriales bacterium]